MTSPRLWIRVYPSELRKSTAEGFQPSHKGVPHADKSSMPPAGGYRSMGSVHPEDHHLQMESMHAQQAKWHRTRRNGLYGKNPHQPVVHDMTESHRIAGDSHEQAASAHRDALKTLRGNSRAYSGIDHHKKATQRANASTKGAQQAERERGIEHIPNHELKRTLKRLSYERVPKEYRQHSTGKEISTTLHSGD